ncbi:MAG: hypothetical protein RLZZ157_104 [Pseudomonadota bacterium]|jgi:outer membrane biosynthesis protein TonB
MENPEPQGSHLAAITLMREQGTIDGRIIEAVQFALFALENLELRVIALENPPPPKTTKAAKAAPAPEAAPTQAAPTETATPEPASEAPAEQPAEQPTEQAAA